MAGRLTTAGGLLLAGIIAVGTWLYIAGIAPPFPWNAHTFNTLVLVSIVYAIRVGGSR